MEQATQDSPMQQGDLIIQQRLIELKSTVSKELSGDDSASRQAVLRVLLDFLDRSVRATDLLVTRKTR
jgi:hypothetical protein